MSTTSVATLRTALGIGTLYADAVLQSVCDASDDVMLPFLWKNEYYASGHENTGTAGKLYFNTPHQFYVGQSVVITQCGSKYNGTKTITEKGVYWIGVTTTHTVDNPIHPIIPYGTVAGDTYVDYSTIDAVKQASLQICEAIWQARQAPSGQGMSVEGFVPSPFTMSASLLARVRGLLAPYLSPGSQVG